MKMNPAIGSTDSLSHKEKIVAWATAGLTELVGVGREYGKYVTYQELSDQLIGRTGITTKVPFRRWIGPVLGEIDRLQRVKPEEPMLVSLVVRADGTIGDGYLTTLQQRGREIPEDLDDHAAQERFRCYQFFGAKLPEDGGSPQLTEKVAVRRSKRQPSKEVKPKPVCPSCFLQLSATGICSNCEGVL